MYMLQMQSGETINNRPYALSHHLSLPKTSAEMANMEKYIQDAVPCKIRAKRGCATHPRSIAERVCFSILFSNQLAHNCLDFLEYIIF